jgi:hypothetical protein
MYASIDFANKTELRAAIKQGQTVVAYSPTLGMAAVTGRTKIEGPWPIGAVAADATTQQPVVRYRGLNRWSAWVDVRDMRVVAVH